MIRGQLFPDKYLNTTVLNLFHQCRLFSVGRLSQDNQYDRESVTVELLTKFD